MIFKNSFQSLKNERLTNVLKIINAHLIFIL